RPRMLRVTLWFQGLRCDLGAQSAQPSFDATLLRSSVPLGSISSVFSTERGLSLGALAQGRSALASVSWESAYAESVFMLTMCRLTKVSATKVALLICNNLAVSDHAHLC